MNDEVNAVASEPVVQPPRKKKHFKMRRDITIAQRKKYVAEYLLSNMKQRDFCNEKDLAYSSFGTWLAKYRNKVGGIAAVPVKQQLPATKGQGQ